MCWKRELILRTRKPLYEHERIFKGRGGVSQTTRPYHLYLLRPEGKDSVVIDGLEFVEYSEEFLDARGGGKYSKAKAILDFIRKNRDHAFFSREIAEALKGRGVKVRDVMSNVRRFERKGFVYVRSYRPDDRQTPFKEGYLITWLDPDKPRQEAIEEAIRKTDRVLADRASASPFMERIHRIRDIVLEHSVLKEIVGFSYIRNKLGCTEYEAEVAVGRVLQLYPDIREVKLFNNCFFK